MLSGYRHELYDSLLREWNRHDVSVANKVESIWCNF
jgi:hypothetical protein